MNDIVNNINESLANVNIYPNPTSGIIHLRNTVKGENTYTEIYDLSGRMISSITGKTLNISYLHEGIYILKVMDGNQVFKTKIIKQ